MRNLTLAAAGIGLLAATAASQSATRAFPADVVSFDANASEVVFAPRLGELPGLGELGSLTFTDLLLPNGKEVTVDVRPLDLERNQFAFQVNGEARPDLLEGLELSVWVGQVQGDPQSEVYLSFSLAGSRGWIRTEDQLFHMLAAPGPDNDWTASTIRVVPEELLIADGRELGDYCEAEKLAGGPLVDEAFIEDALKAEQLPPVSGLSAPIDLCNLKECPIALECDFQLYQIWNNLAAETAYVTTLLSWVSCRYEEQGSTILTFPYLQFWTTQNDPWNQQDVGGDCISVLYEFQGAWAFNTPANANIGHMLSGANLGCGVAWLDVLCNDEYGFSVSGNIDGGLQFPISQQSGNWDFMVLAHELGHNFSSPHTHDLGIDNCAGGQCISNGTIMSYCHLCSGGTANITTYFQDPIVTGLITSAAQACLADYDAQPSNYCAGLVNSLGCTPSIDSTGTATLGGPDNFTFTGDNFVGQKPGLFFYGLGGPAALPFFGGTLCVNPPLARTDVQLGTGTSGSCSGTYTYAFTQAEMVSAGLASGDSFHGQWWTRDPNAAQQVGLSDGLEVTVCN